MTKCMKIVLIVFFAEATWLSGAFNRLQSQSYIQQDSPKKKKEVTYVVPVDNPLQPIGAKSENVKLILTTAIDYTTGQNKGAAYLEISTENGRISLINELWLISPQYLLPEFKVKAGELEKWKEIKETTFKNAMDYFFEKIKGTFAEGLGLAGGMILDITEEIDKKETKEREMDLEAILDWDENLVSIIKRQEAIGEKTLSIKIPFTIQKNQIEVETSDGKIITATYPSSKADPTNSLYAIFSLIVKTQDNHPGKVENIGLDWKNLTEIGGIDINTLKIASIEKKLKDYYILDFDPEKNLLLIGNNGKNGTEIGNLFFAKASEDLKLEKIQIPGLEKLSQDYINISFVPGKEDTIMALNWKDELYPIVWTVFGIV